MYIRMLGNTVQLCRWKVEYKNQFIKEESIFMIEYVPTEEEADAILQMNSGGTKTRLETVNDEWADGLEFETLDKAREIVALGEEGYKKWLVEQESKKPENLIKENESLKK